MPKVVTDNAIIRIISYIRSKFQTIAIQISSLANKIPSEEAIFKALGYNDAEYYVFKHNSWNSGFTNYRALRFVTPADIDILFSNNAERSFCPNFPFIQTLPDLHLPYARSIDFRECRFLRTVNNITIGEVTYNSYGNLITNTCSVICNKAFNNCVYLSRVGILNFLLVNPEWMFSNCSGLTEIEELALARYTVYPENYLEHMFSYCESLEAIRRFQIPSNISIPFSTFINCHSLRYLKIYVWNNGYPDGRVYDFSYLKNWGLGNNTLYVSLEGFFSWYGDSGSATVKLHPDALMRLTDDQIATLSEHNITLTT